VAAGCRRCSTRRNSPKKMRSRNLRSRSLKTLNLKSPMRTDRQMKTTAPSRSKS
jgi:hypothetical protein